MIEENVIREIISDFHERKLPDFTRRSINLSCPENKIRSLVGVRRSGKTFLFYQLIDDLLRQGVEKERILFINFEDERLLPLQMSDLSLILNHYYEIFPSFKDKKVFAFFDEIQNISDWERFVRRIHDTENVSINVTGSSSKLLSKEIATSLRGRTLSFEVFPFSFPEFLRFTDIPADFRTSKGRSHVVNAFESYLTKGGFPECADSPEEFRIKILQDYFNLILYKDLIERYDIRNHSLIKYLLKFLLSNNANPFSVNRFYNDLKSQGYKCSKDTLHSYLSYLEDAYCFSFVPIFSDSYRKSRVNYRKVYAVDHGLVTAVSSVRSFNTGRLLESMVYTHLRRSFSSDNIFYHKTADGREIDFLTLKHGAIENLVQVCETVADPVTQSRECDVLWLAMTELNISHATIVTRNERNLFTKADKTIKVAPFWAWSLENC